MSEFCKHNIHESHYCGDCYIDTLEGFKAEIEELKRKLIETEGMATYKLFKSSQKENEKLKAEIELLRAHIKGISLPPMFKDTENQHLRELVKQAKPFVSGEHHHSLKQEVRKEWNEKAKEILE